MVIDARPEAWWNESDGTEVARGVAQSARTIRSRNGNSRHVSRAMAHRALFENDGWGTRSAATPAARESIERALAAMTNAPLTINGVRSVVLTATATIASRVRMKPAFLTSGGSWSQRDRTIRANRVLDAVFRDGKQAEIAADCFRDACVDEIGALRIFAEGGRVCFERVEPLSVIVDSVEGRNCTPRTLYTSTIMDRETVLARFNVRKGSRLYESIMRSQGAQWVPGDPIELQEEPAGDDMIRVFEAWRLPSSHGADDGRHVICTDDAALLDEKWKHDRFPIAIFRWARRQSGFWGYSLTEEIAPLQRRLTYMLERGAQQVDRCAVPRVYVQRGSDLGSNDADLKLDRTIGAVVYYTGDRPPETVVAQALGPEWMAQVQMLIQQMYDVTGVSRMQATAQKPAGLNSGEALREYADQTSDRAMTVSRAFDSFNLECAQIAVDALSDADAGKRRYVTNDSRTRASSISWKDVALDRDSYVLSAHPTAMLARDFAARKQQVAELVEAGLIEQQQARRMLELPDIDHEMDVTSAPRDIVEMQIDHMMREKEYTAPDPRCDLAYAVERAQLHVLREQVEGTSPDDEGLALVMQYGQAAQVMLDEAAKATAVAPPPQTMPQAPTPPAEIGAPPMGAGGMIQ